MEFSGILFLLKLRKNDMAPVKTLAQNEKVYEVDNVNVKVTHTNKIFFPEDKITKGMLVDYYYKIADYILPYLKGRPQSMKRNPNGIHVKGFYHKDAGEMAPDYVDTRKLYSESNRKDIDYILCNNKATLIYLINLGCIELNPWHSTVEAPQNPDYLVIDIDPSEGNTFAQVIEVAKVVKSVLDRAGATGFCKTSGATGIHIYVPLARKYSYDIATDFAHLICEMTNELIPDLTTTIRTVANRGDKIYLDFLQNRYGQTIASVYCVRPVVGATVSMPLKWEELDGKLSPHDFNIFTVPALLKKRGDIFGGILGKGIQIENCLNKLKK